MTDPLDPPDLLDPLHPNCPQSDPLIAEVHHA